MSTDAGFLSVAVAVAFDDEFVGGGLEPVDSGLREERVGHQRDPFDRLTTPGAEGSVAYTETMSIRCSIPTRSAALRV